MGNKRYTISPEEYIFATLNIYLDIVYLFTFILQLFGRDDWDNSSSSQAVQKQTSSGVLAWSASLEMIHIIVKKHSWNHFNLDVT